MNYTEDYTRQDHIEELMNNVSIREDKVVDALFNAIHEAMKDANVPDELWDDVFTEINNECTIRVY